LKKSTTNLLFNHFPNQEITLKKGRQEKLSPAFKKKTDHLLLNMKKPMITLRNQQGIYENNTAAQSRHQTNIVTSKSHASF
jgi:hypothetical protein